MQIEIKKSNKLIDYSYAIKFLEKRVIEVIEEKKPELLWVLKHKPTYTAGKSYRESEILNKKIKIVKTSRGGKITYHGPGQLVIYFVLNLNKRGKDIRKLLKSIEKCIIKTLNQYDIKSFNDKKNIGIWVNVNGELKKVGAIGIRVKKWIAYHGFCLNINNDLKPYDNIVPCGIYDKGVTNLRLIKKVNYKKISTKLIENFLNLFGKI